MSERREYSSVDRMAFGAAASSVATGHSHPVQASVARAQTLELRRHNEWLASVQGAAAPLHLRAELRATQQVSRLPCLLSSNLMADTLTGANDTIDFGDILGYQDGLEVCGHPHAMIEKQLGLL